MATHALAASQLVPQPPEIVVPVLRATGEPRPHHAALRWPSASCRPTWRCATASRSTTRSDPLPAFTTRWRTRIVDYDTPRGFTDVQLDGPYRRWEHRHSFTRVEGGTRVDDRIEYELPLGPLGRLAHPIVRSELERIFTYRARAIDAIFEPAGRPAGGTEALVVAVAGGTGFVGGAIARELRRRGHRVVVLSSRGEASRGELADDVEIRPGRRH